MTDGAKLYLAPGVTLLTINIINVTIPAHRGRGFVWRGAMRAAALLANAVVASALVSCRPAPVRDAATTGPAVTPVYSSSTGRLEAIESDSNGDGEVDTRAFMDGTTLRHIEIDRDHDGYFERREYYIQNPAGASSAEPALERAEESGPDGVLIRVEHYRLGLLDRVEEDLNHDGRMDKWEVYEAGTLRQLDLDLSGRGRPERRLHYGADGGVDRVEVDPDGDGAFVEEGRAQP